MNNLYRRRLLLSTCLGGAAMLALTPCAQAQQADPIWLPHADVEAEAGTRGNQVTMEMFAPVAQNDANLLYLAGRIGYDERYDRTGSATIGGRGRVGEDVAIGVHAGVDFQRSDRSSRRQTAFSMGLEGFTPVFDLHLNYRLPLTGRSTLSYQDPEAAGSGALLVENNRLIERKTGWRLEEVPLAGVNGEVGARLPLSDRLSVRASLGAFDYRADAAEKGFRGVRGGLELDLEDPLGSGGRFALGARLEDDTRFGTQARATARLSIPFGPGARGGRAAAASRIERQMGAAPRRDYVAASGMRRSDLSSTVAAIDARTGQAFGGIYYVSGTAAAPGAGTGESPTTLGDAVARAGQNGVVVALGSGGAITTGGVTLATNQYLVGGAASVQVRHADGSISSFAFGGTSATITGTAAGGAAVTLGQGSVVRDVTIGGAGIGVLASGVGGFVLDRVTIANTGGAGLSLANTLGTLLIDGLTVRDAGGAGVAIRGGATIGLRNATISGAAGALDIDDGGAALTVALADLRLSARGGTVLDIDGSGAGSITVAGLSGIAIAGGNGETGGFAARGVTFDSAASAGIQAVDAGSMTIGGSAARLGGTAIRLADVTGSLRFADLDIANEGGAGILVRNAKTADFTLATADGSIDTQSGSALDLDPLSIDLRFTSVATQGAAGAGVLLDDVHGVGASGNALTIGTLRIAGSGEDGLRITGGSTGQVTIGAGSIEAAGGSAVRIGAAGVAGSGGTIGLTLGAAISGGSGGPLVAVYNSGGAVRFTGAIAGTGGIVAQGSQAGASLSFAGPVTLTGATGPALLLDGLAGSVAFAGPLVIASPGGDAIRIGTVGGGASFGQVTITGLGAATGLDLSATQGNVTIGGLTLIGTDAAGSRGISLVGGTNAGAIVIGGGSIAGVDIGLDLTNAAIGGSFRFGDGAAGNGLQAAITAGRPILATGMDTTRGRYDLADAQLTGDLSPLTGGSFTAYYVLAGASGSGASGGDAGSLAGAIASGAQYIVLLNDPTGGQDVLDVATLGAPFTLGSGQNLVSFLYSDFFAVTGATLPANLTVSGVGPTGIANPFAGSGSALLTSSSGAATVTLGDNSRIDGVVIRSDTGVAVQGSGVANAAIVNANLSGAAGAIALSDGGTAASVTLANLDLSASGGTVLALDGSGTGTLAVSASGVAVTATGTADALAMDQVTSAGIAFGTIRGGGTAITGTDGAAVSMGGITSSAGVVFTGNGAAINAGAVSVTGAAGDGVQITGNTAVTLGPVTVVGAAGDGIVLSGNGAVTLGAVDITGAAGAGLSVSGLAAGATATIGTVSIAGGTTGIVVGDIDGTLGFTGTTAIASPGGTAIRLDGGSTGTIDFAGVTVTGIGSGGTGVDARNASGTVRLGTLDIAGAGAGTRGIDLNGATLTDSLTAATGSAIRGVETGIDLSNGAITGSFRFGDGSSTDANGAGSTIDAATPLRIAGLNGALGSYDLGDVRLIGDTGGLASSARLFWVKAGATGAGTSSDPGSLAAAAAAGADIIVLLNDLAGGIDTIDANDAALGVGGSLVLGAGQQLLAFGAGDTLTVPGGAPANVTLFGIARGSITNPFAGSGAPILTTTTTGMASTVVLASNTVLDGLIIANAGSGAGVSTPSGLDATNIILRNSRISGGSAAVALTATGGVTTSAALDGLVLASRGTGLIANGAGGVLTLTGLSNIQVEGGQGESGGIALRNLRFDSDPLTAGNQTVAASLTIGSASTRLSGNALWLEGASGALTIDAVAIHNQAGRGLYADAAGMDAFAVGGGTIDADGGDALLLAGGAMDLVFDRIVHTGTGTAVLATSVSGAGPSGRLLDVDQLTASGGNGIVLSDSTSGTLRFGAASSITSPTGYGLAVRNGTGTIDLTYDGSITNSVATASMVYVSGHQGSITFGATSSLTTTAGGGLVFWDADGTYRFDGATTLTGLTQLQIQNSDGNFTFGSGTRINGDGAPSIFLANSAASITYAGVLDHSGLGWLMQIYNHSLGTFDFTQATVATAGGMGLNFDTASGTYRFGAVSLSGGGGIVILGGSPGDFAFGDVDITGLGAGKTAVDLTGATGNVAFASLDIAGTSTSGTRGIDLRGSTSGGTIAIGGTSTIAGVDIGVDLGNAAITGSFRFGDGSNTDGNGAASRIDALTPLHIAGLNGATGTYDFADVTLVGDTSALSAAAYFVAAGASGSGTRSDPGSLAGALAANAVNIVLLNNPGGGTDVIDLGTGSLLLPGGTALYGFQGRDSFALGGGAPANVLLYNIQTGLVTNPFAGSGAPVLTTGGAAATITLGGSNLLDGIVIANSGSGFGVLANGLNGLATIRNSIIAGGTSGAIRIASASGTARVALTDLSLSSAGGTLLTLDGAGAGSLTVTALSNLVADHAGESGGFSLANLTFDADPLTAGYQSVAAASLRLGTTASRIAGDGLTLANVSGALDITTLDIANSGGTGLLVSNAKANSFTLGTGGGIVDTVGGTALDLDPLTLAMTLDSVSASGGTHGIRLEEVGGSFTVTGAVSVTNSSVAGIALTNNAGASIALDGGVSITTATGAGLLASGGGTLRVAGGSIATQAGTALTLDGVTLGAGGLTLASVSANGAATGVLLNALDSSGGGTLALGTVTLQGITSRGIDAAGAIATGISIADLDIALGSTNAIALDLNGASLGAAVTIGDFDVVRTGAAGSTIAVDLRGTTGGQRLQLGSAAATIRGVDTGVWLDAATSLDFVYGDGSAAGGTGAILYAGTAINAAAAPATGSYDFRDMGLTTAPGAGFGIGRIRFIDADGAAGGGDGSGFDAANPMSLADAESQQQAGDVFILVNNGAAISVAGSNGDDSLALLAGSSLLGFGVPGNTLTFALSAPATVQLSAPMVTIADPGNGAATMAGAAGAAMINASGGNTLSGFILDGGNAATGGLLRAAGAAASLTIRDMVIRNIAGAAVSDTSTAGAVVERVTFSGNGTDLVLGGSNLTVRNVTSTGSQTGLSLTSATGTTTLDALTIDAGVTALRLTDIAGTLTATSVTLVGGSSGALAIAGGSAAMTFDAASSISQSRGGTAVATSGNSLGSLAFAGTITATTGAGLAFDNADGSYGFTGTVTLSGATAGIALTNGSGGSFTFGSGTSVTTGGNGFTVTSSNADVTFDGEITANSGFAVDVDGHDGGAILFRTGAIRSVGGGARGIAIRNSNGGSVRFEGETRLETGANGALTLADNGGSTVTFASGAAGLAITTTSGTALAATGGGALTILGTANSIATGTGTLLAITNASADGATFDLNFASAANSGGATGIQAIRSGAGALTGAIAIAGGSITASDRGVLLSGDALTFSYGGTIAASGGSARAIEATGRTGGIASFTGAITDTGLGIAITGNSGGGLTLSGTLNAGGSGATAPLLISGNTGGTYLFSGAMKRFNTGATTAVTVTSNTGATIAFRNGGLNISSSGAGLLATGGGTLSVEGAANVLASGTGTALTVSGTTIAAAGITFQSITAAGGTNGIVLADTGALGGLYVTGTGTAGSGGTIQGMSSDGISLTNSAAVRLAYMTLANNRGDGIGGSGVDGLRIEHLTITANGDAGDEGGIIIANLTGSGSDGARPTGIFDSVIQNNYSHAVQIANTAGTLANFQIADSTIASDGASVNGAAAAHGNLVNFLGSGTAAMGLTVTNTSFTGNWNAASPPAWLTGTGLAIDSSGGSMTAIVSGSTFASNNAGISLSTGAGSTTLAYLVEGNTFTDQRSHAISEFHNGNAPFTRSVAGTIRNNVIGTASAGSGSSEGNGISIANEGAIAAAYRIEGNIIEQVSASPAIAVNIGLGGATTGGGTTDLTILNNVISDIGSRAITIQDNQSGGAPYPTIRVNMAGNSFAGIAGQAGNGQFIRLRTLSGTMLVTQALASGTASGAELDDANGFNDATKISVSGTITYGQPAPVLPAVPTLP